jgi:hypothetical protein
MAKITKLGKVQYIYRSSITGRVVTEKWAKKHPNTTEKERVTKRVRCR